MKSSWSVVSVAWRRVAVTLVLLGTACPGLAQVNPPKIAASARFDFNGSPSTIALTNGVLITSGGSVARQTWLAEADQSLSYSVHSPTIHFGWLDVAFRFTPEGSGTVQIKLMGPWDEESPGNLYLQEVIWDAGEGEGTDLPNASFETLDRFGRPVGWSWYGGDPVVINGPPAPVDGVNAIVTWHNRVLYTSIPVTGGVPVTVSFSVRAKFPDGFPEMEPILGTETPAHAAAPQFMRGVNFGNYLEAPAGQGWGLTYDTNDYDAVRAEGFDHIRLPARWNDHTGPGPDYVISNAFVQAVDEIVTNCLDRGLGVIVNIHHFDEFTADPAAHTNKFYRLWEQIAAHYSNAPPRLALELLNEPKDAATTEVMNPIYAEAITRIRQIDPDRTLFVGPGSWNNIDELGGLLLPESDSNLIVTVHSYDPFYFTHQGASWAGNDVATTGLTYPGPPPVPVPVDPSITNSPWVDDWFNAYNTLPTEFNPCSSRDFDSQLGIAKAWSDYYGRPIHVGEFGAFTTADADSRARFYTDMRSRVDELGLGWAMWDWKAGFRYWDGDQSQPEPGMRDAMLPAPRILQVTSSGWTADGAVAKIYVVEETDSPENPWVPIQTNTLSSPQLDFTVPTPITGETAHYRVQWRKF